MYNGGSPARSCMGPLSLRSPSRPGEQVDRKTGRSGYILMRRQKISPCPRVRAM